MDTTIESLIDLNHPPIGIPDLDKILDCAGQEIKPGSIIAYVHNVGRTPHIRLAKVLAAEYKVVNKYGYDHHKLNITIRAYGLKRSILHGTQHIIVFTGPLKKEYEEFFDSIH